MAKAGTAPAPAVRKRTFDTDERARLRATLLRYIEVHDIGVPTLLKRIAKAAGREERLIPRKTLQRFLGGPQRTHDAALIPYHQFALTLPDYARHYETAPDELTRALRAFFGIAEGAPIKASRTDIVPGRYRVCTKRTVGAVQAHLPGWTVLTEDAKTIFDVPHATFSLEAAADGASPAVHEQVFNIARTFPPEEKEDRHLYEGSLVLLNDLIFILLRNRMSRLPKAYWLRRIEHHASGAALVGYGVQPQLRPDPGSTWPYTGSVDVAFFPEQDRSGS